MKRSIPIIRTSQEINDYALKLYTKKKIRRLEPVIEKVGSIYTALVHLDDDGRVCGSIFNEKRPDEYGFLRALAHYNKPKDKTANDEKIEIVNELTGQEYIPTDIRVTRQRRMEERKSETPDQDAIKQLANGRISYEISRKHGENQGMNWAAYMRNCYNIEITQSSGYITVSDPHRFYPVTVPVTAVQEEINQIMNQRNAAVATEKKV